MASTSSVSGEACSGENIFSNSVSVLGSEKKDPGMETEISSNDSLAMECSDVNGKSANHDSSNFSAGSEEIEKLNHHVDFSDVSETESNEMFAKDLSRDRDVYEKNDLKTNFMNSDLMMDDSIETSSSSENKGVCSHEEPDVTSEKTTLEIINTAINKCDQKSLVDKPKYLPINEGYRGQESNYDNDIQCEAIDFSTNSIKSNKKCTNTSEVGLRCKKSEDNQCMDILDVLESNAPSEVSVLNLEKKTSIPDSSNSSEQNSTENIQTDDNGITNLVSSKHEKHFEICDENTMEETPEEMGLPEFFKGLVTIGKYVSVKGDFTLKSSKALIESPSHITPFLLKEPDIFPYKDQEEKEELRFDNKEFFKSSIGDFLVSLGLSRVNEWYQRDMMLKKLRQAKKEGKSESLNQEIEKYKCDYLEAKKANEPFTFSYKKCSFCGFMTESDIVFDSHLLFPHVTKYKEYVCNYCSYLHKDLKDILKHMKSSHDKIGFIQPSAPWLDCPYCSFETFSKVKLNTHLSKCKYHNPTTNQAPPHDFDFPCLTPKPITVAVVKAYEKCRTDPQKSRKLKKHEISADFIHRNTQLVSNQKQYKSPSVQSSDGTVNNPIYFPGASRSTCVDSHNCFIGSVPLGQSSNHYYQVLNSGGQGMPATGTFPYFPNSKDQSRIHSPPVNRYSTGGYQSHCRDVSDFPSSCPQPPRLQGPYSGQWNKTLPSNSQFHSSSLVVCEICDGYIKDMEQLRTHMQLIHKVKIHPKMLASRPPLNCQKCQLRFFTDQGLERHLLGAHGLVTSNMKELANKGKDSGCCTICGRIFATKLVAHMTQAHKVTLKPAHLSYKCTVCSATFSLYRLFENHVYLVHSGAAKRSAGNSDDISANCKKFAKSGGVYDRENYFKSIPDKENGIS